MRHGAWAAAICLVIAASAKAMPDAGTSGWISHPQATATARPIVLQFRRILDLARSPAAFPVRLSADNRFILFVNGRRVAMGPATSDIAHWRYEAIDLASSLRPGRNEVFVTVWNDVKPVAPVPADATEQQKTQAFITELTTQTGRAAQQSLATGFWLDGDGAAARIATGNAGWQVAVDPGRTAENGLRQFGFRTYYVAGPPEVIDTHTAMFADDRQSRSRAKWVAAVPAPAAARPLLPDPLPAQLFRLAAPGRVVRTTLAGGSAFPARAVMVPAHSRVSLLLQREAMVSAYPELRIAGGKDARIQITYAEALYDPQNKKGDRDVIAGRHAVGIHDTIVADGASRTIMPLWWRTWRNT